MRSHTAPNTAHAAPTVSPTTIRPLRHLSTTPCPPTASTAARPTRCRDSAGEEGWRLTLTDLLVAPPSGGSRRPRRHRGGRARRDRAPDTPWRLPRADDAQDDLAPARDAGACARRQLLNLGRGIASSVRRGLRGVRRERQGPGAGQLHARQRRGSQEWSARGLRGGPSRSQPAAGSREGFARRAAAT